MADFDPYFKWLAIPPKEQPPHHYRLLGLPIFVDDVDVIEGAADQRTIYLRTFQTGPNSELAERLLNEVSEARLCLLTAEDKTEYDKRLHSSLQPTQPIVEKSAPPREKDGTSATMRLPADKGYQLAALKEPTPPDKEPRAYAAKDSVPWAATRATGWRSGGKRQKPLWQEPWAVPVAAGGVVVVMLVLMLLTSWIGRLGDSQNGTVTSQQEEDQQTMAAAEKAAAERFASEQRLFELDRKLTAEFAREDQESAFLAVARRRGNRYLANEEYDKAIVDLSEAIRIDPSDAGAYVNRGVSYYEKIEYDKAIADCNEAIRLDPNLAKAYFYRGIAYGGKKEFDKTMADCNEAIRLDPNYAKAYANRGVSYYEKKEYDKAIVDLSAAIRIDPDLALAYKNRSILYSEMGDVDKAIVDLSEAIRIHRDYATAYRRLRQRGVGYGVKVKYDKAIADLVIAQFNRGNAYHGLHQYDKAIADYNKAIRINPDLALAYNNRGHAYRKKKEYDKAIADYTEAIRIDPDLAAAYGNRAYAYSKMGATAKANADLAKAEELGSKAKQ